MFTQINYYNQALQCNKVGKTCQKNGLELSSILLIEHYSILKMNQL